MTGITGSIGIGGVGAVGSVGAVGASPARDAALGAAGEIGHRVLAWTGAGGGGAQASAAWGRETGAASDFRADPARLAGGDAYGLGEVAGQLAQRFGGTPAEEGALRRSLEGFTREAVVQLAGLSGAAPEVQFAGMREALDAVGAHAGAEGLPEGLDAVAQRLDAGAAVLERANGG